MRTQVKDKRIKVFEVVTGRDLSGNEIKVKKYIHPPQGLWAYARELSEKENFQAKALGSEQSVIFKVGYNKRIRSGLCLEFRGENFKIVSIDGYEFYQRDLKLRAERTKPVPFDHEEYTLD